MASAGASKDGAQYSAAPSGAGSRYTKYHPRVAVTNGHNNFHVAPAGYGNPKSRPLIIEPFDAEPRALAEAVNRVAEKEKLRTLRVWAAEDLSTQEFEQYTACCGFKDVIVVAVWPSGDEGKTNLSMLSTSTVGYSDMGVNEARMRRWLKALKDELRA